MAQMRVGLTGGMGSGKSSVARILAEHGALVVDADAIAREIVEPGTPGLSTLVDQFGSAILTGDGRLDRAALAEIAFADDVSRRKLESIMHPRIAERTAAVMAAAKPGQIIVHDIPLLVELKRAKDYDLVVVVDAPQELRLDRLEKGRGVPRDVALARMKAQASDEERRQVADVWITNDGDEEALRRSVDEMWFKYLA